MQPLPITDDGTPYLNPDLFWIATGRITDDARSVLAEAQAHIIDLKSILLVGIPGTVDVLSDGSLLGEHTVRTWVWHVPGNRQLPAWCASAAQTEIQTHYESLKEVSK